MSFKDEGYFDDRDNGLRSTPPSKDESIIQDEYSITIPHQTFAEAVHSIIPAVDPEIITEIERLHNLYAQLSTEDVK